MFDQILFYVSAFLTIFGAILVVLERNLNACVYISAYISTWCCRALFNSWCRVCSSDSTCGLCWWCSNFNAFRCHVNWWWLEEVKKSIVSADLVPSMGNLMTYFWGVISAVAFILISYGMLNSVFTYGNMKDEPVNFMNTVETIGTKLLTDHVLMFEMSSVLIIGALIGAAIISRPSRVY